MRWSDEIRIETPEQIDVQLEVAGLGSRFVAQVIDWVLKWGLLALLALLVAVVLSLLGAGVERHFSSILLRALLVFFFYVFLLGFDIYFELRHNGQTPGKKHAGIRVVREGGGPVDFQAVCVRNLLGMADFLPSFYALGALLILVTPRGQRLGDLAAGTVVIRERAFTPPVDLDKEIDQLARPELTFTAEQLQACQAEDRHVLRSFFQRYAEMEPEPRSRLAFRLVEAFLTKMGCDPAEPIVDSEDAEQFLASLYRDLESWTRNGQ